MLETGSSDPTPEHWRCIVADHPNLENARAGYAAFSAGDMATINDLLADDIVWHSSGDNILTGDYEGKEAVLGYMATLMQETGGTFRNEVHDMLANDDHGVALVNVTAERKGRTLDTQIIHVFHMRDGKMTEFWSVGMDQSELDDFWSA
jgi:ketosteroid isomerase-like protein